MKIVHTADIHIGMTNYSKLDPETGLESRLLDFFQTFDFIIEQAIKEQVDAFIFAGDAYKTRDPSPTQQRGFGERIRKIVKAGIPVVMVVGNHDTPNAEGKANTLDIYSALEMEKVYVSRRPEFLQIPTKAGILQVITAPWLHRHDFKSLGDLLPAMYQQINPDTPAILVGHLEVEGAAFGSEKGLAIINDVTIPLSLLTDRRLSYVALGHIHKHQVLNKEPLVIYPGSPDRIDFGEEKEEKGFILADLRPAQASFIFIPTPVRKFLTIRVKLQENDPNPTQTVLQAIKEEQIKDAVVRLSIDIPASVNKELAMDQIKKTLSPVFYIAGISRNVERVERELLTDQTGVERLTPVEALQKYFLSKKYSPEKIKKLEKFAAEILS
ncbi:exonuclease SbcCD subunit D [Patescibacteria group bacterium]|nr:exonuclease SbcCD subunit D [Patescibacteria group bacterium]